jgi:hypothetical protein
MASETVLWQYSKRSIEAASGEFDNSSAREKKIEDTFGVQQ